MIMWVPGQLPPRKIAHQFKVRVWFRLSVRIKVRGQFPPRASCLEPIMRMKNVNNFQIARVQPQGVP